MKKIMFTCLAILVWLALAGQGLDVAAQSSPGPVKVFLPFAVKSPTGGAPSITSFTASPAVVQPGQASQLAWVVSGTASLNLTPGVGAVSESPVMVNPVVTTEYTLTASNTSGSTQATVTVTVEAQANSYGFFIPGMKEIELPTSHPTVVVDANGGVHISFTPDSSNTTDTNRPAYYAYCPANCTSATAFTLTRLGQDVTYANLALDPAGRPRLLLTAGLTGDTPHYVYAACESSCTNPSQWSLTPITGFAPPQNAWGVQFGQIFALDTQGRPRFVYQDWGDGTPEAHAGNFYAYCDDACTDPASWSEVQVSADLLARVFDLALSPGGQPRLLWTSYDSENIETYLAYWECDASCGTPEDWSGLRLLTTVSAGVSEFASYALETTRDGKPRLAYYTGTGAGGTYSANYLYYLSCNTVICTRLQDWEVLNLGLPFTHGEAGVDLALDSQDRPRLAYHAPLAAGYGLYYAWCGDNCEISSLGWQHQEIEPSEQVNQELPIPPYGGCSFPQCDPPIPPCTISSWNNGVRPSLALDPAGNPRIAYDADHEQGGNCTPFTDTRLTRFIPFRQP